MSWLLRLVKCFCIIYYTMVILLLCVYLLFINTWCLFGYTLHIFLEETMDLGDEAAAAAAVAAASALASRSAKAAAKAATASAAAAAAAAATAKDAEESVTVRGLKFRGGCWSVRVGWFIFWFSDGKLCHFWHNFSQPLRRKSEVLVWKILATHLSLTKAFFLSMFISGHRQMLDCIGRDSHELQPLTLGSA